MKAMKKYRKKHREDEPYISFRRWLRKQPKDVLEFRSPKVDKILLIVEPKKYV